MRQQATYFAQMVVEDMVGARDMGSRALLHSKVRSDVIRFFVFVASQVLVVNCGQLGKSAMQVPHPSLVVSAVAHLHLAQDLNTQQAAVGFLLYCVGVFRNCTEA